jgi:hypothetical protein
MKHYYVLHEHKHRQHECYILLSAYLQPTCIRQNHMRQSVNQPIEEELEGVKPS